MEQSTGWRKVKAETDEARQDEIRGALLMGQICPLPVVQGKSSGLRAQSPHSSSSLMAWLSPESHFIPLSCPTLNNDKLVTANLYQVLTTHLRFYTY